MLKLLLSFILSILIILPGCGMVFADSANLVGQQLQANTSSHAMNEMDHYKNSHDTHTTGGDHDCCLSSGKTTQERNIYSIFSIESIPVTTKLFKAHYTLVSVVESEQSFEKFYRKNDPPDSSEYISLIGSSVKYLN